MGGTILCAVVDTPEGRAAAQLGAALARRLGARLVLATVLPQAAAGGALPETAREVRGAEYRVVVGPRAERLAEVAAEEGADLIVVGSRRRGFRGRLLGSTLAAELEAATPAPVLVAPPQTRRRSDRRLASLEAPVPR